jgi:predicted transcriptional regulator YheO
MEVSSNQKIMDAIYNSKVSKTYELLLQRTVLTKALIRINENKLSDLLDKYEETNNQVYAHEALHHCIKNHLQVPMGVLEHAGGVSGEVMAMAKADDIDLPKESIGALGLQSGGVGKRSPLTKYKIDERKNDIYSEVLSLLEEGTQSLSSTLLKIAEELQCSEETVKKSYYEMKKEFS